MKIFKLMAVALVAMFGFIACEQHECVEHDHSADLVGTWTCLTDDFAEAIVIKADGTVVSTGYHDSNYWNNIGGNIVVDNGNITLTFEDGNKFEGHFDIIPGMAFSIFKEDGTHLTFNYCKEDLSEEIVGLWVCNEGFSEVENNMAIMSLSENGKMTLTTKASAYISDDLVKAEYDYDVIGDLMFQTSPKENVSEGNPICLVTRLNYVSNGTSLGDIHTATGYMAFNGKDNVPVTYSWLRIKQHLELPGMKYDYIKTFVTNVKGEDKDIPFLNTSFNFAKMDGAIIDKFLKSILFTVEFPEANKIKYSYLLEGKNIVIDAPIEVDGNKMTIKMSANNPAYQDVDMYAFQDQDKTQMHWYMPTTSFEKFFGNTSVALMLGYGQLDEDDTEAIAGVYNTIADAVESINLSLVMSKTM